ncbi:MAG: EamA family transporter [Deltaproteobacteria bacterium]|jgi:drug/metabolite transporter (DMT)-like permease|nr:EamA family transporter [Deltaproteobacteria bacterium]
MSRRFYIIGFLVLMFFDTITQISMKFAGNTALPMKLNLDWGLRVLKTAWIYLALGGYLGSFVTWMTLLKHAPVGPSFAASHMEIISVTLLSIWLFHEPLTSLKAVGGLLILLGVMCLAKDQKPKGGAA